jgi:hypothetical protein
MHAGTRKQAGPRDRQVEKQTLLIVELPSMALAYLVERLTLAYNVER